MAEVSWIKLMVNIFDNPKIKEIETLPRGSILVLIWIKLLCLAGATNDEGLVYITKGIPYSRQSLAGQLRQPVALVRRALEVFCEFGMIEESEGCLCLINWQKYQNIQGLEKIREQTRARVARHRQREKSAPNAGSVTVTQANATEEDLDKDLEKEGGLAVKPPPAKKSFVPPSLEEVADYCRQRNNRVNPVKFLAHYDTRGWMAGKTKMRNWQSAIITWENNEFDKGTSEEEEEVKWAIDR